MKEIIIINSIFQLKTLFGLKNIFNYPTNFKLEIFDLTDIEIMFYQNEIHKLSTDCGCNKGKIFIGFFVFFYIILVSVFTKIIPTNYHLLNGFIFAFTGALIGKIYGLINSNIKMRKIILKIENIINIKNEGILQCI